MGKQIRFDDAARESLRRAWTSSPRGAGDARPAWTASSSITATARPRSPTTGSRSRAEIELENRSRTWAPRLVQEVAIKTGEAAGDSTTTATVLAHSVVTLGTPAIAARHNPVASQRGIDPRRQPGGRICAGSRARSKPRRHHPNRHPECQRRSTVGAIIAEAMERVGRQGVITVHEGRGMQTTLSEVVEAVRFDRGYLSPYFVTDAGQHTDRARGLPDPAGRVELTTARGDAARARAGGRCPASAAGDRRDVEGEALATLVVNRLRGTLTSAAIKAPEIGGRRRGRSRTWRLLTGARLYPRPRSRSSPTSRPPDFGRARRVVVEARRDDADGGRRTRRRDPRADHPLRARARDLGLGLRPAVAARQRLGQLKSGVAVIHVGAPTELAMAGAKVQVEDALARDARRSGKGSCRRRRRAAARAGHGSRA